MSALSRLTDSELQRYFDGELSPRRARHVHRVLADSPEDRRRFAALGEIGQAIRARAEDVADDASFEVNWQRIRARIAEEGEAGAGARWGGVLLSPRWIGGAVAMAVLVAAVVVAVVLSSGEPPRPRNDCVIESLEVGPQAVSTIFTIEDDEGGDPAQHDQMTVIWVSEASDIEATEGSPEEGR